MWAVMQSVPDTGNGKRFGKKKKNGIVKNLHLYMRHTAGGGLLLKAQLEKENKPFLWRAKSPGTYPSWADKVSPLSLSVRQRDGSRHCDGQCPKAPFIFIQTRAGGGMPPVRQSAEGR